ncbi:hypothetical protein CDL15_Pgr004081 [Punica granatum]|uniref:Uncharacterized protein n=1 Tax=Punica granatum TaxID=22663 RepID=A0A218XH37_PUNGR|nr:hypothetical protein CDL15_Pgr004081 [Punica granatum]
MGREVLSKGPGGSRPKPDDSKCVLSNEEERRTAPATLRAGAPWSLSHGHKRKGRPTTMERKSHKLHKKTMKFLYYQLACNRGYEGIWRKLFAKLQLEMAEFPVHPPFSEEEEDDKGNESEHNLHEKVTKALDYEAAYNRA